MLLTRSPLWSVCAMWRIALLCLLSAVLLAASLGPARAGFTIAGTRVIYEEAQGEAAVNISHTVGDTPALMQVWLDDGDPRSQPGQQDLPFILTPVVALLTPGSAQTVRVLRMGELPLERETLLFFNVLEVPPKTESTGESAVRFAMQTRLKFFYRPRGLQPAAGQAPDLLRFALHEVAGDADGADSNALRLRVTNPTPYHITFTDMALHAGGADSAPLLAALDRSRELAPMIAPNGELDVVLKPAEGMSAAQVLGANQARVHYSFVNDLGGYNARQAKLE